MVMSQPVKVAVIGAGSRGQSYARCALLYPDQIQVVAVAEPLPERRAAFAQTYNIPAEHCFPDWESLFAANKLAEAVLVCTTDTLHTAPALQALHLGYDVLLEKPMSPILSENIQLINVAEASGRLLQICHVLRYATFFQTLRQIVRSGRLGRIIHVTHSENLVFWHMAHSFVRGNWRNTAIAGPMILAKCSHDFDILYWILGKQVKWLSSFGALSHFRPENAPQGAPLRCTDGCPAADSCKYYAPRLYATTKSGWPYNVVTPEADVSRRLQALQTGPYGRCVYHSDNDVVDHQTVNMLLEDNTTVTLVMNGQGDEECRTMRYDGTKATLYGKFDHEGKHELSVHDHLTGKIEQFKIINANNSGHGGGDLGLILSFLKAIRGEPDEHLTTARESLESHLLAFAAEQARLNHQTIDLAQFRREANEII